MFPATNYIQVYLPEVELCLRKKEIVILTLMLYKIPIVNVWKFVLLLYRMHSYYTRMDLY